MNLKIEKLLTILDLSEEEQCRFLSNYFLEKYFETDEWPQWFNVCDILTHGDFSERKDVFAVLAFELRDDLHDPFGWCAWDRACWEVWKYFHIQLNNNLTKRKHLSQKTKENYCLSWMVFWAEPIHWIIVALITKEIVADPEEKFDAHLSSERFCKIDDEIRSLSYGIAQDNGEGCFGFWDGPNPSLEAMLEVAGRDENSVIWRFNEDGTDDLIYKWDGDVWVGVKENG